MLAALVVLADYKLNDYGVCQIDINNGYILEIKGA